MRLWPKQNYCSLLQLVRGWNGANSLWEYRAQITKLIWPQNPKQEKSCCQRYASNFVGASSELVLIGQSTYSFTTTNHLHKLDDTMLLWLCGTSHTSTWLYRALLASMPCRRTPSLWWMGLQSVHRKNTRMFGSTACRGLESKRILAFYALTFFCFWRLSMTLKTTYRTGSRNVTHSQ